MKKIILASQSPRRKQLMEMAELEFEIQSPDVDESDIPVMDLKRVPEYLAQKKAHTIFKEMNQSIIVAADTIVFIEDEILGKPSDFEDAKRMLQMLSGKAHQVITGVCILNSEKEKCFSVITEVYFRQLTDKQIINYINIYKPYDKAGAYAIQEWIGAVGIEKIIGDYYNVMGLPIGDVVVELEKFF